MKVITSHLTHLPVAVHLVASPLIMLPLLLILVLLLLQFPPVHEPFHERHHKTYKRDHEEVHPSTDKILPLSDIWYLYRLLLWLLLSESTDGFVPFVFSFSVYLDSSRISGSYALPVPSQALPVSMQLLFFQSQEALPEYIPEMFSSSPYRSFSPFSTLQFSLLWDRHFCRKGNPSSDGASANTFGIPLQKDATSVGRTYLVRYISALFCFQHPSFSYLNGSSSPSGRCINPSGSVSSFFSAPDSFFPSAK